MRLVSIILLTYSVCNDERLEPQAKFRNDVTARSADRRNGLLTELLSAAYMNRIASTLVLSLVMNYLAYHICIIYVT